ncbi:bifunctional DNA-binding transcriptional regulator/O6-methylguanine-DNA methyltransferase Ada [Altererythrobacter aquiaggeris]|uniref:bifunctional DNA-binding transcriptional regulator/O6-methylguanine-DNA methyltransferase Ada n=1 Tax=Aestuarierythrobacter aquiaggeris TaxID=1898396 RepID=UPI003015F570
MSQSGPRIDDDTAWSAVMQRDRTFDGRFVTGVHSTGIYCRPSCAARHPARKNVEFYADGAAARQAGLRACKRCLPDDVSRDEAAVAKALQLIKGAENDLSLDKVAAATGYSPTHFQRVFKRNVGLTPAAFQRALRCERAGQALTAASSVTEAIYAAGYNASSRFYEDGKDRLGMTASAWKNGGAGVTIRWAVVGTSLGAMLVGATGKGVCRLSFEEGVGELARRFPHAELVEGGAEFGALLAKVVAAVEQPGTANDIPLDVKGTAFQEAVWQELRQIPAGETRTYAQIAASVGKPKAVRAAGSANGANNVAVLIPCHRVVRSDGSLGGYAYGVEVKRKLLEKEQ